MTGRKCFSASGLDNRGMTLKTPELLLPAACDFGADAVYAGQPRYSLRARNNELRLEQIQTGIEEAHARGKKFFVTDGWAEVETKNRFQVGDWLEVIHPGGNRSVQTTAMKNLDGETISVATGSPLRVRIPLEAPADGALLARRFA